MITTETLTRSRDSGSAPRAHSVLVAEESDATRAFLAENVPRHIFSVLCPGRFCARSGRPVMSGPAPSR
jgi:hypothetical protein